MIEEIHHNTNNNGKNTRVFFKNKYRLDIAQGKHTVGGPQGLYEIAPKDSDGYFRPELFDGSEQDEGGELGNCNIEKVMHYVRKIANLSLAN